MKNQMIEAPKQWFQTLANLVEEVEKEIEEEYKKSSKNSLHVLLGFASSAKTLVEIHEKYEQKKTNIK